MTDKEKKLLRQQAEAYAFIYDLRRTALLLGDTRYILRTEGIDASIEKRQQEYPTAFKRYFNEALKRAEADRAKSATLKVQPVKENGKRKSVPKREEKKKEKTVSRGRGGDRVAVKPKKAPRKKKKQRLLHAGGVKSKPE
jgi:hypothetical protein